MLRHDGIMTTVAIFDKRLISLHRRFVVKIIHG